MFYTFGQAKIKLARFADGGVCDAGTVINDAIERLSTTDLWRCMKRLVRLYVYHQVLPLPQNVASILRINIEGKPSHVWATDYQFLSAGPGDLDFHPSSEGITDIGAGHCTMFDIPEDESATLFAIADNQSDIGKELDLRVILSDGTDRSWKLKLAAWSGGIVGQVDTSSTPVTKSACARVSNVVLPSDLVGYVSLYANLSDGAMHFLGKYHPQILVPDFRRYRINRTTSATVALNVLAEVRLSFVPLVSDNDVVPFDSLAAVQAMMQSIGAMNAGDLQKSMGFQALAAALMSSQEMTQTRSQGITVENALYDLSPGKATANLVNL
jgi:hypothetical protein